LVHDRDNKYFPLLCTADIPNKFDNQIKRHYFGLPVICGSLQKTDVQFKVKAIVLRVTSLKSNVNNNEQ
jgi:hypothetical protein